RRCPVGRERDSGEDADCGIAAPLLLASLREPLLLRPTKLRDTGCGALQPTLQECDPLTKAGHFIADGGAVCTAHGSCEVSLQSMGDGLASSVVCSGAHFIPSLGVVAVDSAADTVREP